MKRKIVQYLLGLVVILVILALSIQLRITGLSYKQFNLDRIIFYAILFYAAKSWAKVYYTGKPINSRLIFTEEQIVKVIQHAGSRYKRLDHVGELIVVEIEGERILTVVPFYFSPTETPAKVKPGYLYVYNHNKMLERLKMGETD